MLGIVLINYKNSAEIISYVKRELIKIKEPCKIIIIDNSCDATETQNLTLELQANEISQNIKLSEKIFIYQSTTNLGYSRANNFGAHFLCENFKQISHLLFSNSDIKLSDEHVVEALITKLNSLPDNVAAINPRIIGINGKDQTPYRKSSFFLTMIVYYLFFPIIYLFYKNYLCENAKEGIYYHLIGCFLLIKKIAFIEVSGFDENTFLYVEEEILAERLEKKNYYSYYYPSYKIIHETGSTTHIHLKNGYARRLFFMNYIYYFKEYRNVPDILIYIAKLCGAFFFASYNYIIVFLQKKYASRNR